MARRCPTTDTNTAIKYIEEDGGVILTGFTSRKDVEQVNSDAELYLNAILKDVREFEDPLHLFVGNADVQQRASKSLPRETTYITRLFGRSTIAREVWL